MAVEQNFTGWEIGDMGEQFAQTAWNTGMTVKNDGTARSGLFYQNIILISSGGSITSFPAGAVTGTTGTVSSGNHKRVRSRVYFRVDSLVPAFGNTIYCVFGIGPEAGVGSNAAFPHIYIDSARQLAVSLGNAGPPVGGAGFTGTHSPALTVGVWYQIILDLDLAVSGATVASASLHVTTDGLSPPIDFSMTATATLGAVDVVGLVSLCGASSGGGFGMAGTFSFDDLCYVAASNADAVDPLVLPVDTRVLPLPPTGTSVNAWTGAVTDVDEYPVDRTGSFGDNINSSGAAGTEVAFTHASAVSLGIKGIVGLKVYVNAQVSTGTGAVDYKIAGLTRSVTLATSYGTYGDTTGTISPSVGPMFWGKMYPGVFDAMTFGVVKQNAGQLTRVGNIIAEYITQTLPLSKIRGTTQVKEDSIADAEINSAAGIKLSKLEHSVLSNIDGTANAPVKGDLLVSDGTTWKRKAVGVDGRALLADSTKSDGLDWGTVSGGGGSGGKVAQVVNTQTGAVATGTGTIPLDDTIPQSTEGNEYMTLAVTPTSATNKLRIDVKFFCTVNAASWAIVALFKDSDVNALAVGENYQTVGAGGNSVTFTHYMTAGATIAITFKVRAGRDGSAGTTLTFNGASGTRHFGGTLASSITITEIVP